MRLSTNREMMPKSSVFTGASGKISNDRGRTIIIPAKEVFEKDLRRIFTGAFPGEHGLKMLTSTVGCGQHEAGWRHLLGKMIVGTSYVDVRCLY